ncbi:MAG: FecR domain-containing protein [Bdellovibrionaceae bacterium]|nr:FecR domain-containing protein [Bdellovibrio sp.]
MKTRLSDRHWIIFILFLLVVEVGWLLIDLQWIHVDYFSKKHSGVGLKEAGFVMKANDDLKRRGANSLIWEGAKEKDILYYKDSILTLAQSNAKLYLNDQTELQLSENTLVTIEEPDDKTKSEIRLRFAKGDFKARNPTNPAVIQGDDWVVNLEKGSEISLRKDKDSYEFEVISGQAKLQTAAGTQSLGDSKIFKLGTDKEIKTISKNKDLQWKDKKPIRIYVYEEQGQVQLDWQGEPSAVIVQKAGEAEVTQNISSDRSTLQVPLKLGNYKVRLSGTDGFSESKNIEVWRAPRIFLKKPLPRDRIPAGRPVEFVWTSESRIKNYQLVFKSKDSIVPVKKSEPLEDNAFKMQFDNDQDLSWTVEGIDAEGVRVPAFYESPVFIREEPLPAPQLKTPKLFDLDYSERPSGKLLFKKLNMWLKLFESRAEAKSQYDITFQWEPVPGANKYTIEVSATPDFRNPVLMETVQALEFTWRNVKYQKYFWRVAGTSAKGKLGYFSEALEIKLEDIKKVQVAKVSPLIVTPPVADLPAKAVMPKEALLVEAKPEPVAEVMVITKPNSSWGFAWMPGYKNVQANGAENIKLNLSGGVPLGLQLQYQTAQVERHIYQFTLKRSQQEFKPTPASEFALQKSLNLSETWLQVERAPVNRNYRFGFVAHESFYPIRTSSESMALTPIIAFGPKISLASAFSAEANLKSVGLSLLYSKEAYELNFDYEYKYYFSSGEKKMKYYLGTSGNALYQLKSSQTSTQVQINLLIGFDYF